MPGKKFGYLAKLAGKRLGIKFHDLLQHIGTRKMRVRSLSGRAFNVYYRVFHGPENGGSSMTVFRFSRGVFTKQSAFGATKSILEQIEKKASSLSCHTLQVFASKEFGGFLEKRGYIECAHEPGKGVVYSKVLSGKNSVSGVKGE